MVATESQKRESEGRLLFRLALGITLLGGQRLLAELRSWEADLDTREADFPDRGEVSGLKPSRRHQLIGALIATPAALARATRAAESIYDRSAGKLIASARRRLRETEPGRHMASRVEAWRARGAAQLEHWEKTGRAEEAAARALTRAGIDAAFREFLGELAASPELRDLVQEQSVSLTQKKLEELRSESARADAWLEALVHRLRRGRRRRAHVATRPATTAADGG